MPDPDKKQAIRDLTYSRRWSSILGWLSASDDPLTLRRADPSDPNSPWLITISVTPNAHYQTENIKDFRYLSQEQIDAVKEAANELENASNIKFRFVTGKADLRLWQATPKDSQMKALTTGGFQSERWWGGLRKDIILCDDKLSAEAFKPGNDGYFAVLHELCHGLGLSHPADDGGNPDYDISKSIMSYRSNTMKYGGHLREFDVAALQSIYGAPQNSVNPEVTAGDNTPPRQSQNRAPINYVAGLYAISSETEYKQSIDDILRLREGTATKAGATFDKQQEARQLNRQIQSKFDALNEQDKKNHADEHSQTYWRYDRDDRSGVDEAYKDAAQAILKEEKQKPGAAAHSLNGGIEQTARPRTRATAPSQWKADDSSAPGTSGGLVDAVRNWFAAALAMIGLGEPPTTRLPDNFGPDLTALQAALDKGDSRSQAVPDKMIVSHGLPLVVADHKHKHGGRPKIG